MIIKGTKINLKMRKKNVPCLSIYILINYLCIIKFSINVLWMFIRVSLDY